MSTISDPIHDENNDVYNVTTNIYSNYPYLFLPYYPYSLLSYSIL